MELIKIFDRFYPKQPHLWTPDLKLIRNGILLVYKKNTNIAKLRYVFLFNKYLFISKKTGTMYNLKTIINLTKTFDISFNDDLYFQIITGTSKVKFVAQNGFDKQSWIEDLQIILRDVVYSKLMQMKEPDPRKK